MMRALLSASIKSSAILVKLTQWTRLATSIEFISYLLPVRFIYLDQVILFRCIVYGSMSLCPRFITSRVHWVPGSLCLQLLCNFFCNFLQVCCNFFFCNCLKLFFAFFCKNVCILVATKSCKTRSKNKLQFLGPKSWKKQLHKKVA